MRARAASYSKMAVFATPRPNANRLSTYRLMLGSEYCSDKRRTGSQPIELREKIIPINRSKLVEEGDRIPAEFYLDAH